MNHLFFKYSDVVKASLYHKKSKSTYLFAAISQSKSPTGADARRFVRVTSSLLNSQGAVESYSSSDADRIHVGSKIIHERFGNGIITAIEGQGLDTKATVLFDNVGIKQLLLRFAKFKVL